MATKAGLYFSQERNTNMLYSYTIWNNKEGAGKAASVYKLVATYAEKNPNVNVVVIDLSSQTDLSIMLLGDGSDGKARVNKASSLLMSVAGYLSTVVTNGSGAKRPDPHKFILNVGQYNDNLPNNLYLLCGDKIGEMEIKEAEYEWVLEVFRNFIFDIASEDSDWMVFVDTGADLGLSTQMAIVASNYLIIPVTLDTISKSSTLETMSLIYGADSFFKYNKANLHIPKIWSLLADKEIEVDLIKTLYEIQRLHPEYFVIRRTINSLEEFKESNIKSMDTLF